MQIASKRLKLSAPITRSCVKAILVSIIKFWAKTVKDGEDMCAKDGKVVCTS